VVSYFSGEQLYELTVNFLRNYYRRHQLALSDLYDEDSGLQFRASNLCNLAVVFGMILTVFIGITLFLNMGSFAEDRPDIASKGIFFLVIFGGTLAMLAGCLYMTYTGQYLKARFIYMVGSICSSLVTYSVLIQSLWDT